MKVRVINSQMLFIFSRIGTFGKNIEESSMRLVRLSIKYTKKITPGEKVKMTKESVSKLAQKFKLPMNVAMTYKKLMDAGLNPLKIQSYASMLSTYINLMDQKMPGGCSAW